MEKTGSTPIGTPFDLEGHVTYGLGSVISKTMLSNKAGTLTLFSFDAGQGLSEHTAPYDATVQILDGSARITIGGEEHVVSAGEMIIMPANVPHALHADQKFKMLLIMIRGERESA